MGHLHHQIKPHVTLEAHVLGLCVFGSSGNRFLVDGDALAWKNQTWLTCWTFHEFLWDVSICQVYEGWQTFRHDVQTASSARGPNIGPTHFWHLPLMGVSCSTCRCDEEAGDGKILQSTAAVCPTSCEDSLADMIVEKTISTHQLEVTFQLPNGSSRVICFTRRPLGLDFNRHMPITLKHVRPGSHADDLGVEEGWCIRSLQGYDVTQLIFQDVYLALKEASEHLP